MATVVDLTNPCRTRTLRVSVEEKRSGAWTTADVRLLAPGEQTSIELQCGARRVDIREVPEWAKTLIESYNLD